MANVLGKRPLGATGIRIGALGFGSLFASSLGPGFDESKRAVFRAVDLGIDFFDTAPAYADSEEILGRILREVRAPLVVGTKLGGRPKPFDPRDKAALVASVDTSLKLLHRDVVDVLYVHEPDRPQQYDWWSDWDDVRGAAGEAIDDLKRAGKIRAGGLAGTTCAEMAHLVRRGRFDVVLTAFNCSPLFREATHEVLPAARERGLGVVLGSVLHQGALGRRFDDVLRAKPPWLSNARRDQLLALYRLLDETGIPLVELGLRFALGVEGASSVLIGPKTAAHVEAAVAAVAKGPLPPEVLAALDPLAAQVPYRPFEEPMILPLGAPTAYPGPGMANLGAAVKVGKL